MFGWNGIAGFLLLVVTLVVIWIILGYQAVVVQNENSTNYRTAEEYNQRIENASN